MTNPTGVLFTDPQAKPLSTTGLPQAAAYYLFFLTGTTTPAAVYADGLLTTPLSQVPGTPQPSCTADSAGRFNPIYLNPSTIYRVQLFNALGSKLEDTDPYVVPGIGNAAIIGAVLFPRSAAEIAAGVTPSAYQYIWGDVRRYGAVLDGLTDDTTALQNWAKVGGDLSFPVAQTALISALIPLVSNSTLTFVKGGTISSTTNIILLSLTGLTNVVIRGASFVQSGIASGEPAGISLTNCTYCTIENCYFNGMLYNGIIGAAISNCRICNNGFVGSGAAQLQDSGDIQITSSASVTSADNVIDGNFCYGGGEFGIAVWDPYSGVLPVNNVVSNNRVNGASGYGILIYMPDGGDSYNQVIGNHVEGITGAIATNPSSGAGIYVTGAGAGGTVVADNTVFNCCINTANASLAPAGIGVNGGPPLGGAPIVIEGNVVTGMTQYHGILVTGANGVTINGNSVRMPAAQTTIGHAVSVVNTNNATVTANAIRLLSTTQNQSGVFVEAIGSNYSDLTIASNTIGGGHASQIRMVNNGQTYSHVSIVGNVCSGGDANCIPLLLESGSVTEAQVVGNTLPSASATAISQTACVGIRYSCNFVTGTGAVLLTSGVCTASFYDRTNYGSGAAGGVDNAGTGFIIEILGTAVPSVGTWAVGDTVRNSAPSAAGVYEWICTAAGTPGTWKTISNT